MMKMAVGMDEDSMPKKEDEGYEECDIECAAETLLKAEEIKKDTKMMSLVQPMLKEKADAIKSISSLAELKKVAKTKINEPTE